MLFVTEGDSESGVLTEQLLQEKAFARSKKLLRCEKLLDEMRDVAIKKKVSAGHPEIYGRKTEIEGILCDLFNFNTFTLSMTDGITDKFLQGFNPFVTGVAGAAIGSQTVLDQLNAVDVGPEGYRFRHKLNNAYVRFPLPWLRMADNGAQALGVILHEVGHHFYASNLFVNAYRTAKFFKQLQVFFEVIEYVKTAPKEVMTTAQRFQIALNGFINQWGKQTLMGREFGKYMMIISDRLMDNEYSAKVFGMMTDPEAKGVLSKLYKGYQSCVVAVTDLMNSDGAQFVGKFYALYKLYHDVRYILNLVRHKVYDGVFAVFFPFLTAADEFIEFGDMYANEKFADDFAAVHGYGAEMSEMVLKITTVGSSSAFFKESTARYADAAVTGAISIGHFYGTTRDVHPQIVTRVRNMRVRIQDEMNSTDDPKVKKTLASQLKGIEAVEGEIKLAVESGRLVDMSFVDPIKDLISKVVQFGSDDKIDVIDTANRDNSVRAHVARLLNI
jgi:hypothetical protein